MEDKHPSGGLGADVTALCSVRDPAGARLNVNVRERRTHARRFHKDPGRCSGQSGSAGVKVPQR